MKNFLIAFISLFLGMSDMDLFAQEESQKHQRIRIYINQLNATSTPDVCLDRCCSAPGKDEQGAFIEGDFSLAEIEMIEEAGIEYELLYKDSNLFYQKIRQKQNTVTYKNNLTNCNGVATSDTEYPVPSNFSLGSMAGFYTYQEMLDHMNQMNALYPSLINTPTQIGSFLTHENRPIYHQVLTASNGNPNKEQVLFTGIHHAREPMSMTQNIFFMWYLLENYGSDDFVTYLVDNFEMHFVPCINPDGYIYNEENFSYNASGNPVFSYWRGNKRDNDGNGVFNPTFDGVDLNRNYGFQWGINNAGSSGQITSSVYRGPAPFSEPETQAMKYLCENNEFQIALNYHSYGNYLIYPWNFVIDSLTVDSTEFEVLANLFVSENDYEPGTAYTTVGYTANGDSDDWMYGEQGTKNKIYAMTPEIGTLGNGFYPHESKIPSLLQKITWQNLASIATAKSYAQYEDLSDLNFTSNTGSMPFNIEQFGLQSGSFDVSITSLSPNLQLTGPTNFSTGVLNTGDVFTDSFDYELTNNAIPGEKLGIVIELSNGTYTAYETIYKLNYAPAFDFVYSEDFESTSSINNWTLDSDPWGLTTERANSGSRSLTDSPNALYNDDQSNSIILDQTIDLTEAVWGQISFFTRRQMEEVNDYAQAFAVLSDGTEVPLCGELSKIHPTLNQPMYHSESCGWEREILDLSDFLGEVIQLKFAFLADDFVRYEGFYIDDLEIRVLHDQPVAFSGKIMLEGAYELSTGKMVTQLQDLELLPNNQPYSLSPYLYNGTESQSVFPATVVDWLLVEMREGTPSLTSRNTSLVERKAALLLEDGQIVAPDGVSPLVFDDLSYGAPYHVLVRHRNHLDVMSATAINVGPSIQYDFTTGLDQAWGVIQLKEIVPNLFALYAGDFTQENVIQTTDYDFWEGNAAVLNEYLNIDANLDGTVQVTDYDQWFKNKAKIGTPEVQF